MINKNLTYRTEKRTWKKEEYGAKREGKLSLPECRTVTRVRDKKIADNVVT